MSKVEMIRKIRRADYLLDMHFKHPHNFVKIHKGNVLEHELAKFFLAWESEQNQEQYVQEAIFDGGTARADHYVLNTMEVREVLHSESWDKFNEKRKYYPVDVTLKGFESEKVIQPWIRKLRMWKDMEEEIVKLRKLCRDAGLNVEGV